jgi:Pyruvate/2-oxoacid:ferredoxin oxidoreductase gamma subunit
MYYDVIIAGFGGQGILLSDNILAYAAMKEGKHVTFLPTYGVEMIGGTANCTVVISTKDIGSLAVGIGLGAMDFATQYVKEREAFGQPLSRFEAIQ